MRCATTAIYLTLFSVLAYAQDAPVPPVAQTTPAPDEKTASADGHVIPGPEASAAKPERRRCKWGVKINGYRGVDSVEAGSPVQKAGVKRGDLITGVNGVMVVGAQQIVSEMKRYSCGDEVTLTLTNMENPFPRVVKVLLDPAFSEPVESVDEGAKGPKDCTSQFTFRKLHLGMTMDEVKAVKGKLSKPLARLKFIKDMYPKDDYRAVDEPDDKNKREYLIFDAGSGKMKALFIIFETPMNFIEVTQLVNDKLGFEPTKPRIQSNMITLSNAYQTIEIPEYTTVWASENCGTQVSFAEMSFRNIYGGFLSALASDGSVGGDINQAKSIANILMLEPLSSYKGAERAIQNMKKNALD